MQYDEITQCLVRCEILSQINQCIKQHSSFRKLLPSALFQWLRTNGGKPTFNSDQEEADTGMLTL